MGKQRKLKSLSFNGFQPSYFYLDLIWYVFLRGICFSFTVLYQFCFIPFSFFIRNDNGFARLTVPSLRFSHTKRVGCQIPQLNGIAAACQQCRHFLWCWAWSFIMAPYRWGNGQGLFGRIFFGRREKLFKKDLAKAANLCYDGKKEAMCHEMSLLRKRNDIGIYPES